MHIRQDFQKNYHKWFVKDVLRAIKNYSLIEPGESVCVALSGGKDSITLLFILDYINRFSHLQFDLSAAHIKTADYDTNMLRQLCDTLGVRYMEDRLIFAREPPQKNVCYLCARLKRGALSELLKRNNIRKIAYGHHADDVAETFFMNIIQNRKLGSFSPRVKFRNNPMVIIRPMIYLEETVIQSVHRYIGLPVMNYTCWYADRNIRKEYKQSIAQLNALFHTSEFARKLVNALENIDFTNIWSA